MNKYLNNLPICVCVCITVLRNNPDINVASVIDNALLVSFKCKYTARR